MRNPASVYTSPERFAGELHVLFEDQPMLVGLSGELREPGAYLTATLGRTPVAVVRQADSTLRAFVNICRHRGATLLPEPCGAGLHAISCPYHSWTYRLDGSLRAFPGAEAGFDDVDKATTALHPVAVTEAHGMVFARARRPGEPIDIDEALHGAADELADFGLDAYELVESRSRSWNVNWKLVMDTFTEPYHIPWLHRETIAPYYFFDRWIHDAYGPHQRFIGVRKSVLDEFAKAAESEWTLLPHGTIQYLLVPGSVLTHQLDHIELWRLTPLAPDRTEVRTSVFSPGPPSSDKARRHFVKNLDVLLGVTDTEDFPMQERVQRNLGSGAMPEVVYGKMEPALADYHTAVNKMLADAGEPVS